jgi:hypothetical protein
MKAVVRTALLSCTVVQLYATRSSWSINNS